MGIRRARYEIVLKITSAISLIAGDFIKESLYRPMPGDITYSFYLYKTISLDPLALWPDISSIISIEIV